MSKIILQGNYIDLEMITSISEVKDDYVIALKDWAYVFDINMVGNTINIYDESQEKVELMHEALLKRWSPSMVKFDDLTVK